MLHKFILLQLIAHLLGDFIFQPHSWTIKKKVKAVTWYHLWHAMVIFMFSYLLSFDYGFLKCVTLLTIIHFTTDVLKSYFQLKFRRKESFYFFTDQIVHLTSLTSISFIYYSYCGVDFIFDIPLKYIAIAAGFIFCAKPSNILIKNIFTSLEISTPTIASSADENKDLPNAGKLIGVMERFLVLSLILVGQYSAVGLIIAAKSILRFRDNKKNEYVLVGTMLSFGIATILGIIISLISVN
ncbi:MAG: DUF3307 domain-containing protein [Bacteroidetes bacterium]|jgi:hypothetical protein|nr:DUF3307 domain-containing protein [Campylobacteraceae bacterium]MBT6868554.1 DUF3307 domain-containing protein [archaeon]MBT7144210.1 DUF3307 domain-containing protein [Bacteroidota bacterium]MBT7491904.1 DUF3307 domain-containing protein [Bacteroidota bacterium]